MGDWRAVVDGIRRDRHSGATALVGRAAEALRLACDVRVASDDAWRQRFLEAALAVASARPAMGGMARLASDALSAMDGESDETAARRAARLAAGRFLFRVDEGAKRIVERCAAMIQRGDVVLTISASSLVERALRQAVVLEGVICLESRPAFEGVELARRLAEAGLAVTLVSDAAGPQAVARANLVLLGGDTLTPSGLVHKVGTLGLALAAKSNGVPVHSLCAEEKWLPSLPSGALSDGGPLDELCADPPRGVALENPYFDLTPIDLLDRIVIPDDVLAPAEAGRRAADVELHPAIREMLTSA